jgi:hypothetical protein
LNRTVAFRLCFRSRFPRPDLGLAAYFGVVETSVTIAVLYGSS